MSLPQGWVATNLSEIVRRDRDKVLPIRFPELPFLGMEHVEAHSMKVLGTVSASELKSAAVHFFSGDVLYGRLRPYLNKVVRAGFQGLCSAEFIVFSDFGEINQQWVAFLLNESGFVSFASRLNEGDRPRVDFDQIGDYKIHLPPRPEQDRIVAEIEKQFTRLDDAVGALKRVQANLKRYRASVLKAACEGRLIPTEAELARKEGRIYEPASELLKRILRERRSSWEADQLARKVAAGKPPKNDDWKRNYKEPDPPDTIFLPELPEGWTWANLEQLASAEPNSITDGPFGSNLMTKHYTDSGPRVIRLKNVGDGIFHDEPAHISEEHYASLRKHAAREGDIVIAALGDPAPRACLIPDIGPAIVKADCIRFRPASWLASGYLLLALNSDPLRKRTASIIHGIGRPRLNLSEIKAIAVPLPPAGEQIRIAAAAELKLTVIETVAGSLRAQERYSNVLRQSVLKRALEGKLVPQDRGDEPASVLLDRIRRFNLGKAVVRRPRAVRERRSMKKDEASPRMLVEVLKEKGCPLSPEQLFASAGFKPETIDDFYAELKKAVEDGVIEEQRSANNDITLRVTLA